MHGIKDFETIVHLIEEARNRAFQKVNQELVMLYFNVGRLVSEKVSDGIWGDGTVNELARFIQNKYPELKGFNRRGLYRMKQFYETYSSEAFVTPLATQLHKPINETVKVVSSLLSQINWTNLHENPNLASNYKQNQKRNAPSLVRRTEETIFGAVKV